MRGFSILARMPPEDAEARWRRVVDEARGGGLSFERQWAAFREIAPPAAWRPDPDEAAKSNLGRYLRKLDLKDYAALHAFSVRDRTAFWGGVIAHLGIPFATPPASVLDASGGPEHPRWLPGARLNIADSCFKGDPGRVAVVSGGEGTPALAILTYGQLETLADRVAHGLLAAGWKAGDRIALYMPMTAECVAAYLGIVKAGMAVISIADSFSPEEVRKRLRIADAKGIVTVDRFERAGKSIDLYAKVREAEAPRAVVIPSGSPALREGDLLWDGFLGPAAPFRSVPAGPDALTNVLFSSGTTGDPKAIPWTQLTPVKCAMDGHFHQDIRPGDVVAWPTNIGWMMGPWLIYASLVNGAAMALYEGLPSGEGFARFVEAAGVTVLGVVPALVKAWRASGAEADWSRVRLFSSTGEASNQEDYLWLMSRAGYRAPVIEYCGGTEIGGGHITGSVLQPASPAVFTTPALGLDFVVLDEGGKPVEEGGMGELFLVPPSIGLSQTLLNQDHHKVYYAGCPKGPGGAVLRRHGDQILSLPGGTWKAQGRADDTMNLGGIKVSSVELEEAVNAHAAVRESAAVAVIPGGEGADRLVVFAVLERPAPKAALLKELQALVSKRLNPLFRIHDVVPVPALPRTASNKIMRRELRREYLAIPVGEPPRGG